MSDIVDKLRPVLEKIVNSYNLYIDSLKYKKVGKEYFLELYVEKDDMTSPDLDTIVELSNQVSAKLDELDLIKENYTLDVSTSGAEKPIKDFAKFPALIGRYVCIHLDRPIEGENILYGTLTYADETKVELTYKVKTRTKKVEVKIENITKANLAIQF